MVIYLGGIICTLLRCYNFFLKETVLYYTYEWDGVFSV